MATLIVLVDGTVPTAGDFNFNFTALNNETRPVLTGGTGRSSVATGALLVGQGTSALTVTTTGSTGQVLAWPSAGSTPVWEDRDAADFVRGFRARRHTGTASIVSVQSIDLLMMVDSNGTPYVARNVGAFDVDSATAGPTAGGRDQAAAFSTGADVHLYAIRSGATVTGILSATGPSGAGPALPTTYTHYAYLATYKLFSGNTTLPLHRACGDFIAYEGRQTVLSSGASTTEAAVSVTSVVPTAAISYDLQSDIITVTTDGSGQLNVSCTVKLTSGATYWAPVVAVLSGLGTSATTALPAGQAKTLPVVGTGFLYDWDVTTGSGPELTMSVTGYRVPNGG